MQGAIRGMGKCLSAPRLDRASGALSQTERAVRRYRYCDPGGCNSLQTPAYPADPDPSEWRDRASPRARPELSAIEK
jgi:hypothetical protein